MVDEGQTDPQNLISDEGQTSLIIRKSRGGKSIINLTQLPPGIIVLKHSPQADMGYDFTPFVELNTISDCQYTKNKTPLGKMKNTIISKLITSEQEEVRTLSNPS